MTTQIKLVGWCETITQPSQAQWGGRKVHRCICADGRIVSSLAEDDKKVGSKTTGCNKTNPLASSMEHSFHSWAIMCRYALRYPHGFDVVPLSSYNKLKRPGAETTLPIHVTARLFVHMSTHSLGRHKFNSREDWHLCFYARLRVSFYILWELSSAELITVCIHSVTTRWSQKRHQSLNKLLSFLHWCHIISKASFRHYICNIAGLYHLK